MEKQGKCCFCGKEYDSYGNDIRPLEAMNGNRCCNYCNNTIVIPNRLKFWFSGLNAYLVKRNSTGKFVGSCGVDSINNDIFDRFVPKFETAEKAFEFIKINQLQDCNVVKLYIQEEQQY